MKPHIHKRISDGLWVVRFDNFTPPRWLAKALQFVNRLNGELISGDDW